MIADYGPYLASGLWHVHTDVTDGENEPEEILRFAERAGFPLVGFAEHVREDPTYDFGAFHDRVTDVAAGFDVECVVGCEAKVLDADGTLDATPAVLDRADVVYGAFHGGGFTADEYLAAAESMVARDDVDAWAHPLDYPRRNGFEVPADAVDRLCATMKANGTLWETNLSRPPARRVADRFGGGERVVGYDLHSVDRWA